jgi:adenylate kinase
VFEEMLEEAERTKKKGTEVDRTKIVPRIPDDLLIEALKWRLSQNDCNNRGWILDGWPRKTEEAKAFFLEERVVPSAVEGVDPTITLQLDRKFFPESVVQLKCTIDFLKLRIKELPEHVVAGTHFTEEATIRRFNAYKDVNLNEKGPQPVHDFFKEHGVQVLDVDANIP